MNYRELNAKTIDQWCLEGWEWGQPISHEQFMAAKQGHWQVLLTPTKPVPHAWFGQLEGVDVRFILADRSHFILY